jgi:hypothetical protein
MLFKDLVDICSEIIWNLIIDTLCGQNAKFLDVTAGDVLLPLGFRRLIRQDTRNLL